MISLPQCVIEFQWQTNLHGPTANAVQFFLGLSNNTAETFANKKTALGGALFLLASLTLSVCMSIF